MNSAAKPPAKISAVVIGRNEGDRLKRCLTSLTQQVARVVYVDSGSRDDSLTFARSLGVEVVELDMTRPFTAARARNAGFAVLMEDDPPPEYVQFVDGDCVVVDGWIIASVVHLDAHPELGLVTGWRAEIAPESSVYNAMCNVEWHRPAGPITTCGGDMLVRRIAFEDVDGLNPNLIAGEDEEFCLRLGQAGWRLARLPLEMTHHDAAMTRFAEWWIRSVRAGHAFAQIGRMHPEHFRPERRRIALYGVALPMAFLLGLFSALLGEGLTGLSMIAVTLATYVLNWVRTTQGLKKFGLPASEASHHAVFLTISKFPNLIGMLTYHWRRLRRREMRLIEYK